VTHSKTVFDRGSRSDRTRLDLDLWPSVSVPCEPWPTHTQTIKARGQSVWKIEWTDGLRRLHYLPCWRGI